MSSLCVQVCGRCTMQPGRGRQSRWRCCWNPVLLSTASQMKGRFRSTWQRSTATTMWWVTSPLIVVIYFLSHLSMCSLTILNARRCTSRREHHVLFDCFCYSQTGVFGPTKMSMCQAPRHIIGLCACQMATLHKIYWMDLTQTCLKDEVEPITFG